MRTIVESSADFLTCQIGVKERKSQLLVGIQRWTRSTHLGRDAGQEGEVGFGGRGAGELLSRPPDAFAPALPLGRAFLRDVRMRARLIPNLSSRRQRLPCPVRSRTRWAYTDLLLDSLDAGLLLGLGRPLLVRHSVPRRRDHKRVGDALWTCDESRAENSSKSARLAG